VEVLVSVVSFALDVAVVVAAADAATAVAASHSVTLPLSKTHDA